MHLTRIVEQDLADTAHRLAMAFSTAVAAEMKRQAGNRHPESVAEAALIGLGLCSVAVRKSFGIPVEVWSEANRIAADATSITRTQPALPKSSARK